MDGLELVFKPRRGWIPALGFGSWGLLIALPTTLLLMAGDTPPRTLPAALTVTLLGYGLLYVALRAVVHQAHLQRKGAHLCFQFRPLWPFRTQTWPLDDILSVAVSERPSSFWHPATHRGYPVPQPFRVELTLSGGRRARLPLTLSLDDAEATRRALAAATGTPEPGGEP